MPACRLWSRGINCGIVANSHARLLSLLLPGARRLGRHSTCVVVLSRRGVGLKGKGRSERNCRETVGGGSVKPFVQRCSGAPSRQYDDPHYGECGPVPGQRGEEIDREIGQSSGGGFSELRVSGSGGIWGWAAWAWAGTRALLCSIAYIAASHPPPLPLTHISHFQR
eukprot:scaffold8160_cov126-Isochrysis_galbana.AAC.4